MKPETIKVGDTVQLLAEPEIKSKVKTIEPSHFYEADMYHLENGCSCQLNEIKKMKS